MSQSRPDNLWFMYYNLWFKPASDRILFEFEAGLPDWPVCIIIVLYVYAKTQYARSFVHIKF